MGATQNRHKQLFCRRENAFFQYTSAFAACRCKLERMITQELRIKITVSANGEIFRSL